MIMIEYMYPLGEPMRACPVIVCDQCKEEITQYESMDGTAYWIQPPDCPMLHVRHIHERCEAKFENSIPEFKRHWQTQDLDTHLFYLSENYGKAIKSGEKNAKALEEMEQQL